MAAYLIVDVDDLQEHFRKRGIAIDLQELAVGLRGGASLAAGLISPEKLRSVAVADWETRKTQRKSGNAPDPQIIFRAAGYDTFQTPERADLADALIMHYFSFDPEPVDELILATTNNDLVPLVRRIRTTRNARVRMWGSEDVLTGTEFAEEVIFQPLESLLGIQQTKNVATYIDFENIAISLNEAGFTVNLEELINGMVAQAKAHGQVIKMAAYAPWGQRGSLPPLVDHAGREIADEAPSRLMMANIYPMFNLPGKNSADMLIAKDITTDSGHDDAADIFIIASGDRDFNETVKTLRQRGKQVILWSVRSSLSRQLESNPNITIEYVEDFTPLQMHRNFGAAPAPTYEPEDEEEPVIAFTPSQWSSVIIQFDRLAQTKGRRQISRKALIEQLLHVNAVVSAARGEDLVAQAIAVGILETGSNGAVKLDATHPVVEKTRLVRDRVTLRVANTLRLRGWEYVNYGFLLKGLATDRELDLPGMNYGDEWRSNWIDCLVREEVLARELVPHRHNPDDLVPVIKLRADYEIQPDIQMGDTELAQIAEQNWEGVSLSELERQEADTADMVRRVVVSIEQFTSFRGFTWCPLGSLHKRLRNFDRAMSFQRAVEYLLANDSAEVEEYDNPMSDFRTKGISLELDSLICCKVLAERDAFIRTLLSLYEKNILISEQSIRASDPSTHWDMQLWLSIMQTENVLNEIPGRSGQYSLFRTHHTVTLIADTKRQEQELPGCD
ncbi:MAG: NYN domain-containing protein [Anaerolineae bacterium]|nr:NYN domain-containing protein [Anaerolineae bacterium]MCA9910085.1 NYN domain-containing protein [Anaerolineae bacterium]